MRRVQRKRGRPTDYRPEFSETAHQLYSQGATDLEVADALGIASSTLYLWQQKHPEFSEAIKLGKEPADARVERSLYNRAVGYSFDAVKIMQDKGTPVIVPYREHVPPDVGAATKWLASRKPEQWRETQRLEHELVNVGDSASLEEHLTAALRRPTRNPV